MEVLVFTLIPALFILLGIAAIVTSFREHQKVLQAQRWLTTTAELTRIELDEHAGQDGDAQEVLLDYTYNVRGIPYQGHTLAFGYGSTSSPDYHRQIYELLKNRTRIRIFYNPRSPGESVISPQAGTGVLVGLAVGVFFLVFGFGFILLWRGVLPIVSMAIMATTLIGVMALSVYWIGLRKNDPLLNDLAN